MNRLRRPLAFAMKALGFVGSALVILLILHVTVDVLMRSLFGAPLIGTIEIVSMIYMIGICFVPLALVEQRDAHIAVELVTVRMSAPTQRALAVLAAVLTLVVMAALCWRTWLEAMTQMRSGAAIVTAGRDPLTIWPSYFILPVGFGLAALMSAWKLAAMLTGRRADFPGAEPPAGLELADGEARRHG